jgi:uncharacterized membrane protein YfcA
MMVISTLSVGLFFLVALLYSMVGHAGASGYLAVMGFLGVNAAVMKPTALVLNLCVSLIASLQFYRAGHLKVSKLWPFVLTSIPFAYFGGYLGLREDLYKQVIGVILLFSSISLINPWRHVVDRASSPPQGIKLITGAIIGFLAGLTGTGGGIFLSPLLLHLRWATIKQTAGLSSGFIFCNSLAGLVGYATRHRDFLQNFPISMGWFICAVLVGGCIGSVSGSKYMRVEMIRRILGAVLLVAALKLILLL